MPGQNIDCSGGNELYDGIFTLRRDGKFIIGRNQIAAAAAHTLEHIVNVVSIVIFPQKAHGACEKIAAYRGLSILPRPVYDKQKQLCFCELAMLGAEIVQASLLITCQAN